MCAVGGCARVRRGDGGRYKVVERYSTTQHWKDQGGRGWFQYDGNNTNRDRGWGLG